jgi:hypothetical protein
MRSMNFRSAVPYAPEKNWWQRPPALGAGAARRPAPAHGRSAAGAPSFANEDLSAANPLFQALLDEDKLPHR